MEKMKEQTISQYRATARFHRRMEQIFTARGRMADAESARKAAEALEKIVAELEK